MNQAGPALPGAALAAPVRMVDSVTQLGSLDVGCVAVTGSHGGISSARYALAARPSLSIFNDAGVGRDRAGMAALAFLDGHGLAACTVSHTSARIGDSRSTLEDGIISHANLVAQAAGLAGGQTCADAIQLFWRQSCPSRPA